MPTPLTLCRGKGCNARVRGGGFCASCRVNARAKRVVALYERRRGTAHARGYASADWRHKRADQLERQPYCVDPYRRHPGQQVRATHVDHVKAKRVGGVDAPENFQSLCHACHSYKTVRVDGGFGRRPRSAA